MKILTIVGARPQFVKAAALSRMFRKHKAIKEILLHTGQHHDVNMSGIFFEEMEIPIPDYNLQIHGLSHGAMTGQMLEGIERVILDEQPNMVLVYGDTNSTIAGALAAAKLHVTVAHVEAGLRSFNMKMPEEINRILTDRISSLLFCPTTTAVSNLTKEGFDAFDAQVILCGDVMQDAALFYAEKADQHATILNSLSLGNKPFALATFHRQENTGNLENLTQIVLALNELNKSIQVVAPIHPGSLKKINEAGLTPTFKCIDPVGYFDMISLLKNCQVVVTDSGGLQKEAFFFRKFCVTMREQTEWIELVQNGYNVLAGTNREKIVGAAIKCLNEKFPEPLNLYGNGKACEVITQHLLNRK